MKMEEDRHQREIEFQLRQVELENERQQLDREHELRHIMLLAGQSGSTFWPQQRFQPQNPNPADPAGFSSIMMGGAPFSYDSPIHMITAVMQVVIHKLFTTL